jgi:GDP/GTP exchange factor required for growth at low temperature
VTLVADSLPTDTTRSRSGVESMTSWIDTSESDYDVETPALSTSKLYRSFSNQTLKRETADPTTFSNMSMAAPAFLSALSRQTSYPEPTVVQLDDLDLSDDEDNKYEAGPLTRTIRRVPAGRDLRLAVTLRDVALPLRNSSETMSSYQSFLPSRRHSISQTTASYLSTSSNDEEYQGVKVITNFVAEGLDSDEEDAGDVEAALKRLEGQIDEDKQKARAKRVEQQMSKSLAAEVGKRMKARNANDDEDDDYSPRQSSIPDHAATENASGRLAPEPRSRMGSSTARGTTFSTAPTKIGDKPHGFRPLRRKASMRSLFSGARASSSVRPTSLLPLPLPPVHRSFLLFYKTEELATQFALIERDLLCSITWHELVEAQWCDREGQFDVLDWEAFLKRRARDMVEARARGEVPKANAVQASVARFNIVALWVGSEIVLTTNLEERVALVSKFIRLAWVSTV